jgi:hypothetical protein
LTPVVIVCAWIVEAQHTNSATANTETRMPIVFLTSD